MAKMWLAIKREQFNWTADGEDLAELVSTAFQRIDSEKQVSTGTGKNHLIRETTCVASA